MSMCSRMMPATILVPLHTAIALALSLSARAAVRDGRVRLETSADISEVKGEDSQPEGGGVGSAQPCWPTRSAAIDPVSTGSGVKTNAVSAR
jgi:hypothetical protein